MQDKINLFWEVSGYSPKFVLVLSIYYNKEMFNTEFLRIWRVFGKCKFNSMGLIQKVQSVHEQGAGIYRRFYHVNKDSYLRKKMVKVTS